MTSKDPLIDIITSVNKIATMDKEKQREIADALQNMVYGKNVNCDEMCDLIERVIAEEFEISVNQLREHYCRLKLERQISFVLIKEITRVSQSYIARRYKISRSLISDYLRDWRLKDSSSKPDIVDIAKYDKIKITVLERLTQIKA